MGIVKDVVVLSGGGLQRFDGVTLNYQFQTIGEFRGSRPGRFQDALRNSAE